MLEKVVLVGIMGFFDRGGLLQAAVNMGVVMFFLLVIVRRMPSKTEEYNKGNIFSHINILMVYLASHEILRANLDRLGPCPRSIILSTYYVRPCVNGNTSHEAFL